MWMTSTLQYYDNLSVVVFQNNLSHIPHYLIYHILQFLVELGNLSFLNW